MSNPQEQKKKPKGSKKKEALANLKQSIPPEVNAELDKILPDDEYEEEEYDPEEMYEEEESKENFDISKLSPQERTRLENLNRTNLFLKALAIDCYQYIPKLSRKCGLPHVGIANAAIQRMLTYIAETHEDADFPARILQTYNNKVPEGYPNKIYLDARDVNELVNLVRVYQEKLHGAAKVTDPDKLFGEGNIENTKTINESSDKKEHTIMMDNSQQQQEQQPSYTFESQIPLENGEPVYNSGGEAGDINTFASRYATPDIGLMEMALKRIPQTRPNSIKPFITSFTDLYTDWMQNPHKMMEQLKYFFGPIHGDHAFRLWKDYREKYLRQQGASSLAPSNTDYYYSSSPFQQGGLQPMQMSAELLQQQNFDKMMTKTMQMMQMRMMESAMQNQTAGVNSGQPFEEVYDQNGKLIKRIYGNGHMAAQQNPLESTMISALTNIFQETIRGMSNEKIELYKKINQPDTMLTDFTKTIMSNFATQSNPVNQIREMLDITKMVQNTQPQNDSNKPLEALRLEFDTKLGLRELDLKQLEMQHNWEMDRQQQKDQDSNVEKWLGTLVQVGESIFKPVALKFVEGLGGANRMPQNPLAAFAGGQQQPMQQQLSPEYQQAQAMAERQYYSQQQQPARMPPMQPIPPMQQQRQYNQNQQRAMPSEQEINQELAQLSPEQLQEIEDKMTLEDTNRERIRNLIRAHKNSRKFSRPKQQEPTEQQVEAQQVLFNPHQEQELEEFELEEDDLDEDGEERDVPIASGVDKTVSTNVEGQRKKNFRDFAPQTSTELKQKKKMTPQQEAMYASGQMTDHQFANLPDSEEDDSEEEDEYSYQSVPIAGSPRNASQDALIEENLKKTRQTPPSKKKSSTTTKKKEEPPKPAIEEEREEVEDVLQETELIPSDAEDQE